MVARTDHAAGDIVDAEEWNGLAVEVNAIPAKVSAAVAAAPTVTDAAAQAAASRIAAEQLVGPWKAGANYAATQPVLNPSGQLVKARVAFISGAAYSAADWSTPASALPLSLRDFGATGDGAADDTAAMTAALNAGTVAAASNGRPVQVRVTEGRYLMDRFTLPVDVSLVGVDRASCVLVNRSTDGLVFINSVGSGTTVKGLTIDGRRDQQVTEGLAALQFAKPNQPSGSPAVNISGGLTLSAAVGAGDTTLTVTTLGPVPVRAGDAITLVQGTTNEIVRVAPGYNKTSTAIPLSRPLMQAFTAAAFVSVACTDITVTDCNIYGNGRDGLAFFRVIGGVIHGNYVRDFSDTGIDLPEAGSRHVTVTDNIIETDGRWGVSLDSVNVNHFPRNADHTVSGNTVRFLNGGTNAEGSAIDGVYIGNVEGCVISGNQIDLTKAGVSGLRLAGDGKRCTLIGNSVTGPAVKRANTFGVRRTAGGSVDTSCPVIGNVLTHLQVGVDMGTARSGTVVGNVITDVSDWGVNVLADAAVSGVQQWAVTGNHIDGCLAGVRFGGNPAAGSRAVVRENIVRNASLTPVTADAGWEFFHDANPGQIADTVGATVAALEGEVNALKAQLRRFGVLRP